jgi:DNA polymerase family B
MAVSCDAEGAEIPAGTMHLRTASFGREDGSSGSWTGDVEDIPAILMWYLDNVYGPYTAPDGRTYQQNLIAFHHNWDSSVIAKHFSGPEMYLVHKATSRGMLTPLCDKTHPLGFDSCEDPRQGVLHRRNPKDVQAVITDGGEGDLAAYDPVSNLAICITPGRRLYVEHRPKGDRFEDRRVLDFHDTGRSFQGGLEDVIKDWNPVLSDEQRAAISWGKAARSGRETWRQAPLTGLAAYSEAECVAHARVTRQLVETLRDAAHIPMKISKLYGSGSIANAALKHHHAPRRDDSDLEAEDVADMTYFGGMIETPVIGLIPGAIQELDLNSAYPSVMYQIPCTKTGCGKWVHSRRAPAAGRLGHVKVLWDLRGIQTSTPPFMVRRKDGCVAQPLIAGETWVTAAEYQTAIKRFGRGQILLRESWTWIPDCQCGNPFPFTFLADLYGERLQIKKRMKEVAKGSEAYWTLHVHQLVLKLVLNSMYGKMAQQRPDFGVYTNLHIASHITGVTRAKLRMETWKREDQGGMVVYQHTDSTRSIGGAPEDQGATLGAWGREDDSYDFLVLQPGLAVSREGKSATRGAKLDAFQRAIEVWRAETDLTDHPTLWPKLHVDRTIMMSRRMAIAQNKPHMAGTFDDTVLSLSMSTRKRDVENAIQLPGIPTAWALPPVECVWDAMEEGDLSKMRDIWEMEDRDADETDAST